MVTFSTFVSHCHLLAGLLRSQLSCSMSFKPSCSYQACLATCLCMLRISTLCLWPVILNCCSTVLVYIFCIHLSASVSMYVVHAVYMPAAFSAKYCNFNHVQHTLYCIAHSGQNLLRHRLGFKPTPNPTCSLSLYDKNLPILRRLRQWRATSGSSLQV